MSDDKCNECHGSGQINPTGGFGLNPGNRMVTCPSCGGSGKKPKKDSESR